MVQWVGALTVWVQTLVWELSSHRLHSMAKKTKESVDSQTLRRLGRLFFGKAKGVGGGKKLTADSKIKMACACNPS